MTGSPACVIWPSAETMVRVLESTRYGAVPSNSTSSSSGRILTQRVLEPLALLVRIRRHSWQQLSLMVVTRMSAGPAAGQARKEKRQRPGPGQMVKPGAGTITSDNVTCIDTAPTSRSTRDTWMQPRCPSSLRSARSCSALGTPPVAERHRLE